MLKNIIANFIGRFWSILSNFIFIPIYINVLGFESYSIISFSLVIAGLMAILDSGLSVTLSRELARSDLNRNEKNKTFETLETLYFIVSFLAVLIVIVFSDIIANGWINSDLYNSKEISFFIKIISFDIGFQLLIRFYLSGFIGLEKQVKSNIIQVGWGITRNGLVILIILFIPSLNFFFLWQVLASFMFAIISGLLFRREICKSFYYLVKKIDKVILKNVWKFAGGILMISIVAALNTQMDKIAISKLLPVESLGYYTLAVSLAMGITIIVNPISIAILPRLTSYFTGNKVKEAQLFFKKINLIVSILLFSIMSTLCFFSFELIFIWTGRSEIANEASKYLPVIAIATTMLSISVIPYNIAIANGYTLLNNIMGVISLVITIPGYWIVINQFGVIGAAYVFCFVQSIITIIYIYIINKKYIGIKTIRELFFKPIFMPLMISLSLGFIFSFTPEFFSSHKLLTLSWIGISTIFTFCFSIIILVPRSDLSEYLSQINFLKIIK